MSDSAVDLDLTEIHFDALCKVDGLSKILDALLAANGDDVKRWSSCPSFERFIHKIFWHSQSAPQLAPVHGTGSIDLERLSYHSTRRDLDSTPGNDAASITLTNPSTGKPVLVPIVEILSQLHGYAQHELHRRRLAVRFRNKTIKYADVQNFPSGHFTMAQNKDQLEKLETLDHFDDLLFRTPGLKKLGILTAFEEHLEIIGNRMKDNGYNIKIYVPYKVILQEIKSIKSHASRSASGFFDLGGYMNQIYFLPLITYAVRGQIKNGEFAFFYFQGPLVCLSPNHQVDDCFKLRNQ
ncbi:hypothetical protein IL306_014246 [Fusarium sp. DS 682]|nr:hypothetical protein IL306_014246 [Fusarium sp. DS 682]